MITLYTFCKLIRERLPDRGLPVLVYNRCTPVVIKAGSSFHTASFKKTDIGPVNIQKGTSKINSGT